MADAVIYDRGYQAYQGDLRGRKGARRAIARDGIRRILGLRRKAGRKVFPWVMLSIGVVYSVGIVVATYFAGSVSKALAEGLPSYPELFDFYSGIAMVFLAVTIPEILGPDRRQGVLSVYFSRPLTLGDYLGGKALAYLITASLIYLVPQLAMYIGTATISDEGFFSYLVGNIDVLGKILVVTLVYVIAFGIILAVVSAFIDRTGFAAATFLGVNSIVAAILTSRFPGSKWAGFLVMPDHAAYIRDQMFGVDLVNSATERYGFSVWWSVAALVLFAAVASRVVYLRYRRLV